MLLALTFPLFADWAKASVALLSVPAFGISTFVAFSTEKSA
jgi:hypothetical protein